jgi:hypothetical protein
MKIFISSVVNGFEQYREAAKKAIELMGGTPVMSEKFGARAYSSETACIHEVEKSDVYVLVMGENYGYVTQDGISVTHAEYKAAIAANRPVLAFIKRCDMEPEQVEFRKEVEHFQGGFFRASFESPEELKDEIISALRQLETMSQAIPEEELNSRVAAAIKDVQEESYYGDSPAMVLAFLPQPERNVDIVGLEEKLDDLFQTLSHAGLVSLREGFKQLEKENFTGLHSGELKLACFADGMVLLRVNPTVMNESLFSGRFAPPDKLRAIAIGFQNLVTQRFGYVHIGLYEMDNVYVAPMPKGSSMSVKMFDKSEAHFNRLFAPFTPGAYSEWVDQSIKRFGRTFKYEAGQW